MVAGEHEDKVNELLSVVHESVSNGVAVPVDAIGHLEGVP